MRSIELGKRKEESGKRKEESEKWKVEDAVFLEYGRLIVFIGDFGLGGTE